MFTLNCKGRMLVVDKPLVMGIINLTPDSFYAGSRFNGADSVLKEAEKMINDGADIIDLGGQSTRPGSKQLSVEEELKRVTKTIESVHLKFPEIVLSVDTFYSKVAVESVSAGASIVNDISGGNLDAHMIEAVGQLHVPYVCMHMKGSPENMQNMAQYQNVSLEVLDYFIKKQHVCNKAGIHDLIIDPGFGFSKNIQQNFQLLHQLSALKILNCPILCGLSRKSTIYKTLGITAEESLNGSTVMHTIAILNGANILRVHDVKEARQVVNLVSAFSSAL